MTKPREKTREELQAEIEDGKKKIRQFENREKMLRQKLSKEERRTRSHRLIVRGAVFVLGFVMGGRSYLPVGIEKGQSIFSAALVGGYSILVCCFQIYKIACCSAIAIFSIPFSCYFINISAQFKSEYVSNNSYIFAVCSRLSPMFVTPALHT